MSISVEPAVGLRIADVVCLEDSSAVGGLPPRKAAHRRSSSDVPLGYFPPSVIPKAEAGWGDAGDANADDLLSVYLNLEVLDGLDSSEDRHDGGEYSHENDDSEECGADSCVVNGGPLWANGGAAERTEVVKRNTPTQARHARSLSMDSLMGKLNLAYGAASNGAGPMFSVEFGGGGGEFTPVEMKKIMSDDKLAEMALADPKRVKRVLANRQSAARSKERKTRYTVELEKKVQILQTAAATVSAQINVLQRDTAGTAAQNSELRFRLQAMEQQAQLRDALNEALTGEVQRLKMATAEAGDSCSSAGVAQLNQMFQLQLHQQQATLIPFCHHHVHHQQNGS